MAIKFHEAKKLLNEYSAKVVSNDSAWKSFLTFAGGVYKYPFWDQLLIYAQRPDATAVASMEIWNERMHCWINRGSKGIALIEDEATKKLRYVFDVKDVHEAKYGGRKPQLWEMIPGSEEAVLSRLEQVYGSTDSTGSFSDRIMELADRIAEDYVPDLLEEIDSSSIDELNHIDMLIPQFDFSSDEGSITRIKVSEAYYKLCC